MAELYFTEQHEWLSIEDDIATVGITDYAQAQMGDLVFVEMPETGALFSKGDDVAVVESVKVASDVYAPVSGEITQINSAIADDAGLINKAAEKDGWIYKIKLSDASELETMMDRAAYHAMIA